jgi:hypothetical protein
VSAYANKDHEGLAVIVVAQDQPAQLVRAVPEQLEQQALRAQQGPLVPQGRLLHVGHLLLHQILPPVIQFVWN